MKQQKEQGLMAANLLNVMNLLAYGCMVFTTIALASEKLQVNSLFESYDDHKVRVDNDIVFF